MIDFDNLRHEAEEFAEQHSDQIDRGIDKAAQMAGKKYGHGQEIEQAADKLEEMLQGADEPAASGGRRVRGKPGGASGPRRGGRPGSVPEGPERRRRPKA